MHVKLGEMDGAGAREAGWEEVRGAQGQGERSKLGPGHVC